MTLVLRVRPGADRPFSYRTGSTEVVIGRSRQADISIASDRFISKRHARVFQDRGDWFVEDLNSRNTTLLNGRVLEEPEQVVRGDVIRLSNYSIEVASTNTPDDQDTFLDATQVLESSDAPDLLDTDGNPGLRRYAERLALLNEVHRALAHQLSRDELLSLILERAYTHLQPEEAVILLEDDDGRFEPVAASPWRASRGDYLRSRKLTQLVAKRGMAALVQDVQDDARLAGAQSLVDLGIRSIVAAPILYPGGRPGMIALATRATVKNFTKEDMDLLVSLAAVAGLHMRNLDLHADAARRQQLEKELTLARDIQVGLFPETMPSIPGYDLFASNIPSRTVSGDLYRIHLREEACVFMVADVSGKGMAASLLTASLEAISVGPIEADRPPDDICQRLSRRLHDRTPPERFATAFIAVLEPKTGIMRYTSAGHNPAFVVRRDGSIEELSSTGMPLGIMPDAEYACGELGLDPGDALIMYTDGITEAANPAGAQYGENRLKGVCCMHSAKGAKDLAEAIASDLARFVDHTPYEDDRTLVIARREISASQRSPI